MDFMIQDYLSGFEYSSSVCYLNIRKRRRYMSIYSPMLRSAVASYLKDTEKLLDNQ